MLNAATIVKGSNMWGWCLMPGLLKRTEFREVEEKCDTYKIAQSIDSTNIAALYKSNPISQIYINIKKPLPIP